jgi:hypothetical protein
MYDSTTPLKLSEKDADKRKESPMGFSEYMVLRVNKAHSVSELGLNCVALVSSSTVRFLEINEYFCFMLWQVYQIRHTAEYVNCKPDWLMFERICIAIVARHLSLIRTLKMQSKEGKLKAVQRTRQLQKESEFLA